MAGIAGTTYILGVIAAVVVLWGILRRRPRADGAVHSAEVHEVLRAARRRALVAVLFAVTIFVVVALTGLTLPQLVGLPFGLAPTLAGAAGLLLYAATPPQAARIAAGAPRQASLRPRTPWAYVSRPLAGIWLGVIAAFVAYLGFTGATADTDERGRSRQITFEATDFSSSAGPYPGWFYGVPMLLGVAVLVLATIVALRRVSASPAFSDAVHAGTDERWRRISVRTLMAISLSALLLAFGGTALVAGNATHNAVIEGATPAAWSVFAGASSIGGLVLMLASIGCVTLAALWAVDLVEGAGPRLGTEARR